MRLAPKSIGVNQGQLPNDRDHDRPEPNVLFASKDAPNKSKKTTTQLGKRSAKQMQKSTSVDSQQENVAENVQYFFQKKNKQHEYDDFYDVFEEKEQYQSQIPQSPVFGQFYQDKLQQQNQDLYAKDPSDNAEQIEPKYDYLFAEKDEPQLESIKQITEKQPNINAFLNAQKIQKMLQPIDNQIQDNFVADWCGFCDCPISEEEQKVGNYTMLQSSECFHNVHVECLKKAIKQDRAQNGSLNCPLCYRNINDYELKTYVSEAEWKDVENFVARQILQMNPNLKQCECGNIIEFVKGEVNLDQKDDKGQKLSVEAATHMAEYRIRCNECHRNFCHKCKVSPYHLGKTCDQLNNVTCRFCLEELKEWNYDNGPAFQNVCKSDECQKLISKACDKILDCGHPCFGIRGEKKCLPCLEPECIAKMDIHQAPNVDKDEYCSICYTTGLGQQPCIQLDCDHIVHHDCLIQQVSKGWNGARIVFNHLDCSQCKRQIACSSSEELNDVLKQQLKFKQIVQDKAKKRAEYDNLQKDQKFLDPNNPHKGDLLSFAMSTLSYYQCFKCKDAYFVGRKDCAEQAQLDVNNLNKETLLCPKCAPQSVGGGINNCPMHGTDYIEFKCKYCCNRAVWFCWGNTHFCDPCHRKAYQLKKMPVEQLPKCKGKKCELKMAHPAPGQEFALGCGLCAEKKTNFKDLGF